MNILNISSSSYSEYSLGTFLKLREQNSNFVLSNFMVFIRNTRIIKKKMDNEVRATKTALRMT